MRNSLAWADKNKDINSSKKDSFSDFYFHSTLNDAKRIKLSNKRRFIWFYFFILRFKLANQPF